MTAAPTIFVQIASYRDPECQWTVKDLFEKAEYPEAVTVGICAQCDPDVDKDCFAVPSPRPAQTKVMVVPPSESEGVCWARALTQTLFDGEDYVLMIDSHMRFIEGWDAALIEELGRCDSEKSFLSTYPPGYKPPNDLEPNPKPIVMRAKPFNELGDIRFDGEYLSQTPEKPLRGAFLAGGLLFARGNFVTEIPYDPQMYFDHEEITLAARAFTHGWDVYSPTKAFVYHYYNEPQKDKGEKRALHWVDRQDWSRFQDVSRQRYRFLLCRETPQDASFLHDIERFGLGNTRTLEAYEAFSGLDFRAGIASPRALTAGFIPDLDRYRHSAAPEAAPAPAFSAGDALPSLIVADNKGKKHDLRALAAGKRCVLCLVPAHFDDYLREFMAQLRAQQGKFSRIEVIFIAPVSSLEADAFRQRNGLPPGMLLDEAGAVAAAFGNQGRTHDTPVSCLLDAHGKVEGLCNNRNAHNHMAELLQALTR